MWCFGAGSPSATGCALPALRAPSAGPKTIETRIVEFIDANMDAVKDRYHRLLDASLNYVPVTLVFGGLVLASIFWLYSNSKSELAPNEDQGIVLAQSTLAPNATLQQKLFYGDQAFKIFSKHPEVQSIFQINSPASNLGGLVLTPADKRKVGAEELQRTVQQELAAVAGIRAVAFQPPPTGPKRQLSGMRTSVKNTSLKWDVPEICLIGRTSTPGVFISSRK